MKCAITLLRRQRSVPSTREIAKAAGVAEGTIFKVFPSKDALITAAAEAAFCPIPFQRQIESIDPAIPLRERLVAAVGFLQLRFTQTFELMEALGLQAPPPSRLHDHPACTIQDGHRPSDGQTATRPKNRGWETSAVARLIAPDAAQLRCTPGELVNYLRLLTFSGSHSKLVQGPPLTPETIVDVLLNGVQLPPAAPRRRSSGTRKAS